MMKKIILLSLMIILKTVQAQLISDYYFEEESLAAYVGISGGTTAIAASNDDGEATVPIGFTFKFNGTDYTQVTVGVNGAISFTETQISYSNDLASNSSGHKNMIAPLWDDLYLRSGDNGVILYKTIGVAPLRKFIVEWKDASWFGSGQKVTFSLTLNESYNSIEFRYGTTTSTETRSASIGINDGSGHFISITPGNPATSSTTTSNDNISSADFPSMKLYRFTPEPPVNDSFYHPIEVPSLVTYADTFLYAFNIGATNSGGDTPDCASFNGGDVWYKFTAPTRGAVQIKRTVDGPWGAFGYAIYPANNYTGQELMCGTITESHINEIYYIYNLEPGTQYKLRVWEFGNNDFGTVQFALRAADNDGNLNAFKVDVQDVNSSNFVKTYANNEGATESPNQNNCTGNNFQGGDVWFKFTAPISGKVNVYIPETTDWSSVAHSLHETYNGGSIDCGISFDTNLSGNVPAEYLYTGLTPGNVYYLRMFDYGNNNFGTAAFYLVNDSVLGIEDYEALNFKYYPNPTTDFMNITSENTITKIEVMNITGQQVIQMMPQRQKAQINLSDLPKGIYLMKVNTGDNSKVVKIIKK